MTDHYESSVKSNVRRKAKSLGLDLASIQTIVKADKKFYRLPLTAAPTPKPEKVAKTKAPAKPRAAKASKFAKPKSDKAPRVTGANFETVATMLREPGGAAISAICKATKWLPHTARARISVNVSKLLGMGEEIQRRRENGESHYAIVKSKQAELPV